MMWCVGWVLFTVFLWLLDSHLRLLRAKPTAAPVVRNTEISARPEHPKLKAWVENVPVQTEVWEQVKPLLYHPKVAGVRLMPDCHVGIGCTVGTVLATKGAIIPAAVGVDIGCGMIAARTTMRVDQLPDNLERWRSLIEAAVPHGGPGSKGSWNEPGYKEPSFNGGEKHLMTALRTHLSDVAPSIDVGRQLGSQMGTLGGGNHFIEVSTGDDGFVWLVLHSGSRGVGNKVGTYFISKAREEAVKRGLEVPGKDLEYFDDNTDAFHHYWKAVELCQQYAALNRLNMLNTVTAALNLEVDDIVAHCHHNYAVKDEIQGERLYITRKGAVAARAGQMGVVPGSMGRETHVVTGLGNGDSYYSCAHGAGRTMSRGEAKRSITLRDHIADTSGVECRKDSGVVDESPRAYKDIKTVMHAQRDLVETAHVLKQVVCVKG